ncbi:MAG: C25 family cysteine peptidase [candidate division WOR-3 bacterium]
MKNSKKVSLFVLALLLLPYLVNAGILVQTFEFEPAAVKLTSTGSHTLITIDGAEFNSPPGTPLLPKVGRFVRLPAHTSATGIEILSVEFETLPGTAMLPVAQPPVPLSLTPPPAVDLKPELARLNNFYPETLCAIAGQGELRNDHLLALLISPVQYLPTTHQVRVATRIKVAISLEKQASRHLQYADSGPMNYLLITSQELDSVFRELATWRTLTGLPAALRHIEWIVGTFPGADAAEKLRNYLQLCARDSGLQYLLLAGDTDIIPGRKAFAFASGAGLHPREDSLPCDLYYSDLDGTWDANGNHIYGEPDDSVDLFPDIFVGRVPVRTREQARAFVTKLLTYERNLLNDYQHRALLSAAILWTDPWTDEMHAKEKIRDNMPPRFQVRTLYESQMPITVDTAIALLNAGCGLFNHCGHGWIDALALSRQTVLRNSLIDQLTNRRRPGITYSIGCWTAAFDFDCIGEHFLLNPDGGGVAYIGNSSYGWGAPGNPGFGYSDRFDRRFFELLFSTPAPRIGALLAQTKTHFIPFSFQPNVYRWHQFCLNLLGDPAMPVHTDTLSPLYLHKPLRLPSAASSVKMVVLDPAGAVNQATVTLTAPDCPPLTATSAPDGTVTFELPRALLGTAYLTVTAPNHRPLTDSIPVQPDQKITIVSYQLIDSTGDANGYISAGETFTIRLYIKNISPSPLYSIRVRLATESPLLTIEQDFGFIPVLPPETIIPVRLFLVRTAPDALNGSCALCTITITDSTGVFNQFPLNIQFSQPVLKIIGYNLISPPISPDTCALFLKITNTGLTPAPPSTGTVFNPDWNQKLTLITPGIILPPVSPAETVWSLVPCRFTARTDPLRLGINLVSGRFAFSDTLTINLRTEQLFNNFDSGPGNWSISGANGSWFLTAERYYSPRFSIHAGNPDAGYPPNCTCLLLSPEFKLPNRAVLSFLGSFELPTYGTDGIYCLIITPDREETLDFIGAGGALKEKGRLSPTGSLKWVKFSYDLSFLEPGAPMRLKFVFVSDSQSESAAGFYLDDIQVQTGDSAWSQLPKTTRLLGSFPNPFGTRTTIFFALATPGFVKLSVYTSAGSLIRTLIAENIAPGYHSLAWDGTTETGTRVPAGVYFLQLEAGHLPPGRVHRKIIKAGR